MKGKNMLLRIGNKIFGYATDCNFTIDTEVEELSDQRYKQQLAGSWKEREVTALSWACDSSHLYPTDGADVKTLFEYMTSGKPVFVAFLPYTSMNDSPRFDGGGVTGTFRPGQWRATDDTPGSTGNAQMKASVFYAGAAIITNIQIGAPVEGQATYQAQLQGTGELTVEAYESDDKTLGAVLNGAYDLSSRLSSLANSSVAAAVVNTVTDNTENPTIETGDGE